MSTITQRICRITHAWVMLAALCFAETPEEEIEELARVVVVAKSVVDDQKSIPVPGNDTVISRQTIERSGAGSIAELLEREAGVPFVSFFGDAGLGTPVLRGFGENASPRTLILVDGLPVTRPDIGAVPWYQFSLNGLQRVELLRGSRTVRYGSSALAGVISLETRRSNGEFGGYLESAYGSDSTSRNHGELLLPIGEWGLTLQAEDSQSDGYRENSAYEATSWSAVLSSPRDSDFHGRWVISGNELRYENPGSLGKEAFLEDPRQSTYVNDGVADEYFNEIESLRISQLLSWDLGAEVDLSVSTSWFERDRMLNFGAGNNTNNYLDSYSLESVLSDKEGPLRWEVGVRGQRDDLDWTGFDSRERQETTSYADLRRDVYGGFALGRYEFADSWHFTAGVGWESYSLAVQAVDEEDPNNEDLNFDEERKESDFAAELALEFSRCENWSAWLRYDKIYRYPVTDEISSYQGFPLAVPFNFALEPERGHSVELGWSYHQANWGLEATAFAQMLEDEIIYDVFQNLNVNFSDTNRYGLEFRGSIECQNWRANLNYTGISATFDGGEFSGERIPLVPRHVVSGALSWIPNDDLTLTIEGRYVSSSPDGNDFSSSLSSLPSYAIFNAQCRWQMDENLSMFFRVNNLLDRQYATVKYLEQWYPAPGRQVIGGVKWEF